MAKSLKKISRIFLLILLVVVTICFAGCSEIQSMTVTNEDGTIDELVYVTLDETAIEEAGYTSDDIETLKNDIQSKSLQYANNFISNYNNSVMQEIIQATNIQTKETYQSIYNGISIVGNSWENGIFVIGLRFKNDYAYNYFYYGTIKVNSSEGTTESHFFYDKISFSGYSKYALTSYNSLRTQLSNYFSTNYPELVGVGDDTLLYTYITDSSRIKSDADYVTYLNGSYYHTWVIDNEDTSEVITIYYYLANRSHWLVVCVGAGLVIACIIFVIAFITNKRKNKNNQNSESDPFSESENNQQSDGIS